MSQKYLYLPRVRLYSDNPRDRKILEWLGELPSGFKGDGIKDAMWASISGLELTPTGFVAQRKKPQELTEIQPPQYLPNPPKNGTMKASVSFDTHELLVDIRQIVEAAVAQALVHHGTAAPRVEIDEKSNKIEALLDNLDMNFMLDDDDDDDEEEQE